MTSTPKLSLFRRSNGIYYVQYMDEGRFRWKSTRCTTKAEALKAVSSLRELLKRKPAAKPLSVFSEEFLAHARANFSASTVEIYARALKHLLALAEDLALSSLTPKHLDLYKTQRLSTVSAVSVNMELRSLKAALNTAVRWGLLEVNPFHAMQQASVPDIAPPYFTLADFQKLLALVKENWLRELVIFSVGTGARQAETLNLKWQDIDLSRKVIHIQSTGTFRTKTGARRTIPMSDTVHAMLSRKAARPVGEYVFNRRGFKIGESYLQHRFKFYIREAKLDEALHWHSLRHSHASWLVQNGVSLYAVQQLLGHSSSRVTEVYSHLQPETLHSTVNKIVVPVN